jgi:hypothetical protein
LEKYFEVVVAYFKALVQHLPGGTEENYKDFVRPADLQAETQIGDV